LIALAIVLVASGKSRVVKANEDRGPAPGSCAESGTRKDIATNKVPKATTVKILDIIILNFIRSSSWLFRFPLSED
jgi:hypothetical protein